MCVCFFFPCVLGGVYVCVFQKIICTLISAVLAFKKKKKKKRKESFHFFGRCHVLFSLRMRKSSLYVPSLFIFSFSFACLFNYLPFSLPFCGSLPPAPSFILPHVPMWQLILILIRFRKACVIISISVR